jgi:hypothetical protein
VSLIAPGGLTIDPTPIAVTDIVATATGITVGDASNIGGTYMLAGESIQFVGNSIHLHVAAGDALAGNLVTGYLGAGGFHARYEFDNLVVAGQDIVGITVYAFDGYGTAGFSGVLSGTGVTLVSPHRVAFNLDDLIFSDRGGGQSTAYGEFRIDLLTVPQVPEPAAWALLLAGLAGHQWRTRVARRRA